MRSYFYAKKNIDAPEIMAMGQDQPIGIKWVGFQERSVDNNIK